jgi:hypothetical protein
LGGTLNLEGAEGALILELDLVARSAFTYARIGFNVVHPRDSHVGRSYRASGPRGKSRGTFPLLVQPIPFVDGFERPLIPAFTELDIALSRSDVSFMFSGDEFETEDQRNFGDASYKTFSTPLDIPIPLRIESGQRLTQRIEMVVTTSSQRRPSMPAPRVDGGIRIEREVIGSLPEIGLMASSTDLPLTPGEIETVRSVDPRHLRVDASPDGAVRSADHHQFEEARALGAPVELGLTLPNSKASRQWARELFADLAGLSTEIGRVVALTDPDGERREFIPSSDEIRLLQTEIDESHLVAPLLPGARAFFTEANRSLPSEVGGDGIVVPYSPTVHTWESPWLFSNLGSIEDMATTMRERYDMPLHISPVSLATRNGPWPRGPAGNLPPQVDTRQMSLIGASWTVGLLAAASRAGIRSLTLYETVGPLGIAERIAGSEYPDLFPSTAGALFPLGSVLRVIGQCRDSQILHADIDVSHGFAALALRSGRGTVLLVANTTSQDNETILHSDTSQARIRMIGTETGGQAGAPGLVRTRPGRPLSIELGPYAVCIVEMAYDAIGPPVNQ